MKIAMLLSGLPRFWTGFQKEIWGNEHDVDYFLHHWIYDDEQLIKDTGWYKNNESHEVHDIKWSDSKGIREYFLPKVDIAEEFNSETKKFFDTVSSRFDMMDGIGRRSVVPMYYSINKVTNQFFTYVLATRTKYDIVIRARFDTRIKSPIEYITDNGIFIPSGNDFCGINDQFAYGDVNSMLYYGDLYFSIIDYLQQNNTIRLNPEMLLKSYLYANRNISIYRFKHEISLER